MSTRGRFYVVCYLLCSLDRARDTKTDEIVALKKVRMDKEKDGECVHTTECINVHLNVSLAWTVYC